MLRLPHKVSERLDLLRVLRDDSLGRGDGLAARPAVAAGSPHPPPPPPIFPNPPGRPST